jgi:hypothetical protein
MLALLLMKVKRNMSRHQNAGQIHDLKIDNRCFENVAQFRYLRMTITNQNLIQKLRGD